MQAEGDPHQDAVRGTNSGPDLGTSNSPDVGANTRVPYMAHDGGGTNSTHYAPTHLLTHPRGRVGAERARARESTHTCMHEA